MWFFIEEQFAGAAREDQFVRYGRPLGRMDVRIPFDDVERLEKTVDAIADHLDLNVMRPHAANTERTSPAAFRFQLMRRAHG